MSTSSAYWEVAIQGHSMDLEYLARRFKSGPVVVVRRDDQNGYVLRLAEFANCPDSESVLAAAERQLVLLTGVLKVDRNAVDPLKAGAVYKKHPGGGLDVFVFVRDTLQVRIDVGEPIVAVTDSDGRVLPQPIVESRSVRIMRLCATDSAVEKAMRLVAAADARSWVGLYRIYEVVESDVGGQAALGQESWGSETDQDRFKHSANSVTVAGDHARHGKEYKQPPKDPMTLEEAGAYVDGVLKGWLASKGA